MATEKPWSVKSLHVYSPPRLENFANSLVDLLCMRGVDATCHGSWSAETSRIHSARSSYHNFYIEPAEVIPSDSRSLKFASMEPYFVFLTEYSGPTATAYQKFMKNAECVLCAAPPIIGYPPEGCVSRIMPPPLVAPMQSPSSGKDIDVLCYGKMDTFQQTAINALGKRWRIRQLHGVYGSDLSTWIARARIIVIPAPEKAAFIPVTAMSEALTSGAQIVVEDPSKIRPRLYDERVVYVPARKEAEDVRNLHTAITSAMLGKNATTCREEVHRLEMATYHVLRESLKGFGRPGPNPKFLTKVQRWLGDSCLSTTINKLAGAPGIWRALETRTLTKVMRSVPPLKIGEFEKVCTVCLCDGDPDATQAAILSAMAAFPQYTPAVACAPHDKQALSSMLVESGLTGVQVFDANQWTAQEGWSSVLSSPEFWEAFSVDNVLIFSDSILLKASDLTPFLSEPQVCPDLGGDLCLALCNVKAMQSWFAQTRFGKQMGSRNGIPMIRSYYSAPHIEAALSKRLFPGTNSVIGRVDSAPRPPGIRVAVIDSYYRSYEETEPGAWIAGIVLGLINIDGAEIALYSELGHDKWSRSIIQAWGGPRKLDQLSVVSRESFKDVVSGDYDLLVDLSDQRESQIQKRIAETQWLCCLDPGKDGPHWRSRETFAKTFDKIVVGSVPAYHRYVETSKGVVPSSAIALVPSPAYDTRGDVSGYKLNRYKFLALVSSFEGAKDSIVAFRQSGLSVRCTLTIGLMKAEPHIVAEIQAYVEEKMEVVVAETPSLRKKLLSNTGHVILDSDPEEWTRGAGFPAWVLEVLDIGCTPLFHKNSPAADALIDRVHGGAYSTTDELVELMRGGATNKEYLTEEGREDIGGMLVLHTSACQRQSLVSLLLGGRGALDTGMLEMEEIPLPQTIAPPPRPVVHEMHQPPPAVSRPPASRSIVPTRRGAPRRRGMGMGIRFGAR